MKRIKQLTVEEMKAKLDAGEKIRFVDVREPHEHEVAHIEGAILIPLSEFAQRAVKELNPDEEIVIHCHHGGRSQRACEYLAACGFNNLSNLTGGIDDWSLKIDSSVARY